MFEIRIKKLNKQKTFIMLKQEKIAENTRNAIRDISQNENKTDELISKICLNYDVKESHIRRVADWKKTK